MTSLLDVNLLMALLWENHEHHSAARAGLKKVSAFATCPVSQLGFARVSSHLMLGANQITNRYLVALARQHGCNLTTLDEPLAKAFTSEPSLVELIR